MSLPSRRGLVVVAILALAAALGLWWRSSSRDAGPLAVTLHASHAAVGPRGSVHLEARVRNAGGAALRLQWLAGAGPVMGSGPRVRWVAPERPGEYEVEVVVRAGAREARARTSLVVRDYVRARADRGAAGTGDDHGAAELATDEPYRITRVALEKDEICVNEDLRVEIEGVDPSGDAAWVTPRVVLEGGTARIGHDAVVHLHPHQRDEVRQRGKAAITVELLDERYPVPVASRALSVAVKDCEAPAAGLLVECAPANDPLDVRCRARVRSERGNLDPTAIDEQPVQFAWSFVGEAGGGPPVVTDHGEVRMRVPERVATRATHHHVIRARGHLADGRVIEGRDTYLVGDPWFEQRERLGVLVLDVQHAFPTRAADGTFSMAVRVRNPFDEDILLDELRTRDVACDEPGDDDALAAPRPELLAGLFPSRRLAPRAVVTFPWTATGGDGRCAARGFLIGRGASTELPIRAEWDMPTVGRPPVARAEAERVERAMQLLRQRTGRAVSSITLDELQDLEREGAIPPAEGERPGGPPSVP